MSGPAQTLRVGIIQMSSGPDKRKNHDTALKLMLEAVRRHASVLSLPENFSYIGDDTDDKLEQAEDPADSLSARMLSAFAAERHVAIIGGSVPLKTKNAGRVTNSTLVFDQTGALVARYDKIHLFDADFSSGSQFRESSYVLAGTAPVSVSLMGWQVGLTICYDLRFPDLFRTLASGGAHMIMVPSAFTRETGSAHWEILLRARAIENLCYIAAPAQWGDHTPKRSSHGHSLIADPWGRIVDQIPQGDGVIVADLDRDTLTEARSKLPGIAPGSAGISA